MDTLLHDSLEAFFVHLERIHPLSSSLKETLKNCMIRECLPPRSLLLEEGEVCDRVYYVARGLARGFYQVGKEEVTAWFVQGGDWMVSVSSFFDQKTSQESIELLEETVLLSIHYEDLNQIYQQSPEFNYIGRCITQHYYGLSEQRSWSLRRQTAQDRYHYWVKENPHLLDRIPLKHVASYLGMKPETLSRLRSKALKGTP